MRTPTDLLALEPRDIDDAHPSRVLPELYVNTPTLLATLLVNRFRDHEDTPPAVTVYTATGAVVLDDLVDRLWGSPEADVLRGWFTTHPPTTREGHHARVRACAQVEAAWATTITAALTAARP